MRTTSKGSSLARGPAATMGLLLLAAAILGMTANGDTPPASGFPDGTVQGSTFLGVETNGWTNVLLVGCGGFLLLGAVQHWAAKTTSLIVGLVLGAASLIALRDGDDILGLGAANGATSLLLGAASAVLLITALLPRVGGGHERPDAGDRARERDRVHRDPVTPPRDREGVDVRTGRFRRDADREPATSEPATSEPATSEPAAVSEERRR
jgi:hypothetical protein